MPRASAAAATRTARATILCAPTDVSAPPAASSTRRNVVLHVSRLDDLEEELIAAAERVTGDERTVLYEFSVSSAGQLLLSGRASIVVDAAFGAQPVSTGTHS